MKQTLLIFTFCLAIYTGAWAQTATAPTTGDGSETSPYQITTLDNLYWLSQNSDYWSSYFEQTADIDASGTSTWDYDEDDEEYNGFSPIGNSTTKFTGNYNGQGFIVDGLTINRSATDYLGLFGYLSGASIANLGVTNVFVTGDDYLGCLAGYSNSSSSVSSCYVTGEISGDDYLGGIVGYNYSSDISTCYANVFVAGDIYVGGLVGRNYSSASISSCYALGKVSGATYVAGLVGYNSSSTISTSYFNSESSGQDDGVDYDNNSQTVTSLTTEQMKLSSNFTDWDFSNTWEIEDDVTFPRLLVLNNAPIILHTLTELASVSSGYSQSVEVVAMDNQDITLTLETAPDGMAVTDELLTWSPTESGSYDVEIKAEDANGYANIYSYSIEVIDLDGEGTESNPYQISTIDDLQTLSETSSLWGSYFIQTADIDASETSTWNSGDGFSPIGDETTQFTGNFDGQEYVISGLTINTSSTNYIGLFGYAKAAIIKNIGLDDVNVEGWARVGSLVGNCEGSTVSGCYSSGSVSGGLYCGGFAGYVGSSSIITNSYCIVDVVAIGQEGYGGFIGRNIASDVTGCYNGGSVSGQGDIGGFIGSNETYAEVKNCYSTASVYATGDNAGGFIGKNWAGIIENCYSCGNVFGLGDYVVGFIGYNSTLGTVTGSYYNSTSSNQDNGLGYDGNSQSVTSLTTDEMMQSSNFTDWDFTDTWDNTDGVTFPHLVDLDDVPIILHTLSTTNSVDVEYNQAIQVVSTDNQNITLSLQVGPEGMELADETLVWTPTANGSYDVEIVATDDNGFAGTYNYSIEVSSLTGDGTASNPYQIGSLNDLMELSEISGIWSRCFVQTADIDASETSTWNSELGFSPIGNSSTNFTGSYDGQGFSISSLTINRSSSNYVGLFGYVEGAVIENVVVESADLTGSSYVGGIAGYSYKTEINACSVSGVVIAEDEYAAGIAGYFRGYSSSQIMSLSNCNNSAEITCDGRYVGGISSFIRYAYISQCNNSGSIVCNVSSGSAADAGGIIGTIYDSGSTHCTVINCYNTGSVTASNGNSAGGILGSGKGTYMYKCYSTGAVTAATQAGGLTGWCSDDNSFENCYTTQTPAIADYTSGSEPTTSNIEVISASQMQTLDSFTDWDFAGLTSDGEDDVWCIVTGTNNGYPIFMWQVEDVASAVIDNESATLSGSTISLACDFTSIGLPNPVSYGFCYSTSIVSPDLDCTVIALGDVAGNELASDASTSFIGEVNDIDSESTYYICAYATNASGTVYSSVKTIKDTSTDIGDVYDDSFSVYPNPATTTINVEGSTGIVYLYNITGNMVLTQDLSQSSSINVSDLTNGIYLLKVDGEIIKVVKK
jgi:hypothetical protein